MLLLLSSDRWVEGEGKGGVKGSLLMKQKKKGKICFVIYIAGKRKIFVFIYEVIVKQKIQKRPANHYSQGMSHSLLCLLTSVQLLPCPPHLEPSCLKSPRCSLLPPPAQRSKTPGTFFSFVPLFLRSSGPFTCGLSCYPLLNGNM
jgi:hypothetical protein